jgi:hypothetical protein
MTEITTLVAQFGTPVVITAAVIYVLLHSDIRFNYPRRRR